MPDKTSNGRADMGYPPMTLPFNFESLMELNRPALNAMAQMNGKVYDGLATMNRKLGRVHQSPARRKTLPCRSSWRPARPCRTCMGSMPSSSRTPAPDYQSEFEQMTKIGKSLADDTIQAIQSHVEEARETRPSN
jgi:hypothetical protein